VDAVDVDFSGADEHGLVVMESRFQRPLLADARFTGCRFIDVEFVEADAPDLGLAKSVLQDVTFSGSRLGGVQAYAGVWTRARVASSKVGYVNLRAAKLTNARFENCEIGELDLSEAQLNGVGFPGCRIGKLTLTSARCAKVDLRGAALSGIESNPEGLRGAAIGPAQVVDLAPTLAAILGMKVSRDG
jgi:uncharacterized protein YjbI with pentapeptide repeats